MSNSLNSLRASGVMTVLDQVDAGFNLWDRYKRWKASRNSKAPDNVASRFVRLFESHGIARNQIPRFFDHSLTFSDLKDDDALLEALNSEMVSNAAEIFGVKPEWLECADSQIYKPHDFYKKPAEFKEFLDGLIETGHPVSGFLFVADSRSSSLGADGLIVLEEEIGHSDNEPVYRYHLCNNWLFSYWKSRAYLTACISIAWERGVCLNGRKVPFEFIERYSEGEELIGQELTKRLFPPGVLWHPEDMALDPEKFIDGLDEGSFGQLSGIELWMDLDAQGFGISENFPSVFRTRSFKEKLIELKQS